MESCWYKSSRRSSPLWSDNLQETLIERYFFSLKRQGKNNKQTLLILCHLSISLKAWGSETHHHTNRSLCTSYCTQFLLLTLVLREPGTRSMGSSRCQARAFLLHPRHHLSGSRASSHVLPFYMENVTQTFPLSSSFAFFSSFIFSW